VESLKELMGHRSILTTQTYLRRLDRVSAMERVRTLSWSLSEPDKREQAQMGDGSASARSPGAVASDARSRKAKSTTFPSGSESDLAEDLKPKVKEQA
jgi:hypothetical protein